MTKEVLPIFDHVTDHELAQAASEPFLRRDQFVFESPTPSTEGDLPVSVGVAYLSVKTPKYGFVLSGEVHQPLQAAEFFIGAYDLFVGSLHKRVREIQQKIPIASQVHRDESVTLLEKTRQQRVRVLAMFAILQTSEGLGFNNALIFPKKAAEEIPLEQREQHMRIAGDSKQLDAVKKTVGEHVEHPDAVVNRTYQRIATNAISADHGALKRASTYYFPTPEKAKAYTSAEERIGDFFALPRKERRARLTSERKLKH
jgi:hypothetical protein